MNAESHRLRKDDCLGSLTTVRLKVAKVRNEYIAAPRTATNSSNIKRNLWLLSSVKETLALFLLQRSIKVRLLPKAEEMLQCRECLPRKKNSHSSEDMITSAKLFGSSSIIRCPVFGISLLLVAIDTTQSGTCQSCRDFSPAKR